MNHSTLSFAQILLGSTLLATALPVTAQFDVDHPCGANELHRLLGERASDPALLARIEADDAALEAFTRAFEQDHERGGGSTYIIPVVFHIIHNNGPENIQDAQILDAVRILNEDFNKENADWDNVVPAFLDIVGDVNIEFRLAQKDPNGNCTKGITRTVSTLTNAGDQSMKDLIQWPRNRYLNVWVAASADGAAGYTFRPNAVNLFPEGDGIVIQHTYTGSINTSTAGRSRALTHEVGHWLNLAHTWGNSNEPGLASNCNEDDSVSDTPNTIGWTSCTLNGTTCGSLDNVENFMEYSYCSKMFTAGQSTRMIAALNSNTAQRSQLWQASNLTFTGVASEPQLCAAQFSSNTRTICAGSSVDFIDESFNSVSTRNWSFPGGEPATSAELEASVTYAVPGVYPVTLTVSDGVNTLVNETVNYITVLSDPGAEAPDTEDFEALGSVPGGQWAVANINADNTFTITDLASVSGTRSARIVNSSSMAGRLDELISGTYDMSDASQIVITFKYAFARRVTANDDRLRLLVSNNCGQTWSVRKQLRGTIDLATAPNTSGSFVPTAAQWSEAQSSAMSSIYHVSDFRFKFEFESDGGNNVYIDDINLNGYPTTIGEVSTIGGAGLSVQPNPASGQALVAFQLERSERIALDLLDVTGRVVRMIERTELAPGTHSNALDVNDLLPGVYFVRMQGEARQEVVRLVVQ